MVPAFTDIPRFSNELHAREDRILVNDVEERGQPVDVVELTSERGREIEPKAVDVHLRHPVSKAVGDQLERARTANVEAVAAVPVTSK